jgi:hypothetical protein
LVHDGQFGGRVDVEAAGALDLGPGLEDLSVAGDITLAGTLYLDINRDVPASDLIFGAPSITLGGRLVVRNLGATPQLGDAFWLIDAAAYDGGFAQLDLPALAPGLAWDTNILFLAGILTVQHAPAADTDYAGTLSNEPVSIPVVKLVENDSDADGDALSIVGVSASSTNGGGVALAGGFVTYTPVPGFVGYDAFTYTVSDGRGGLAQGLVVVRVDDGQSKNIVGWQLDPGTGFLTLDFAGIVGRLYRIQATTSLAPPIAWDTIGTRYSGTNGLFQFIDTNAPAYPQRFYRTVQP